MSVKSLLGQIITLLKTNKKVWLIFPVVALVVWFAWSKLAGSQQATVTPQTAQVEKGTLIVSVSSSGQVSSTNSRSVSTNVSGVVKKVFVTNDQVVKSGDKIAEIELDTEAQQSYTQALASYQSAKNSLASAQASLYTLQAAMFGKWDSYKELSESDEYKDADSANRSLPEFHISEKEWLAAEAQYKNQQSVVAAAQTSLNSASQSLKLVSPIIYAPISGKVTGLSLMESMVITTQSSSSDSSDSAGSTSVASIMTDANPTISVALTEIDVTKVTLNDKATITLDALSDKTYTGKVMSIDTVGSVSSGVISYPAVIVFDTEAPEVFSNMSAQVNIITDTKTDVVIVPSSAVQTQNDQSFVQVIRNGKAESVTVVTGLTSGTQIEVVSGLNEGDTIITSSAISNGTKSSTQTSSPFSGMGGGGAGMMTGTMRVNK